MLIPLGTDRPLRRPTVVTWVLIVITVIVFLYQLFTGFFFDPARGIGGGGGGGGVGGLADGLYPVERLMLWRQTASALTLVSYAFLHASWWHLAGNMLFLSVFGPSIEDRFGRIGFLAFYLLGAAAAGAAHIAVSPHPVLGASGAVAACTGAFFIMFPRTIIRAFSLLFVIGIVNVPAWWIIGLSIIWDLVAGGAGVRTGVAHAAHLGGYFFGAAISFALLGLKIMPREPYDVFSMARQLYRRKQIKSAIDAQKRATDDRWARAKAPPAASPRAAEEAARSDALAAARAEVSRLLAAADLEAAAAAYKKLADQFPVSSPGGSTTLSRRAQYQLANHYFSTGDHRAAVYAYERFIEAYPHDPETPTIRLLLGRVNARYLNDPIRAKALLIEAIKGLKDEDSRAMARRELEALG